MTLEPQSSLSAPNPDETIRMLQEELAQTNRDVLALTLELDTRLEQLRQAEERYRRLAENAPDIIYRCELQPKPHLTFVNPRTSAVTGYTPEEYLGDANFLLAHVHSADRAAMEDVLSGERPGGTAITARWLHKNGSEVWMEQHHSLTRDSNGSVIAVECIARDVTERKGLEEQLRQSQKMEAIGRLAGGVAHDFNNLLTVIIGYGAQALAAVPADEPLHGDLQEMVGAADRAASLTRQLLAFSRRQVLQPQVWDLNRILEEVDRMVRRMLGEDIDVVTILTPGIGPIHADRSQMEQVILNLVVNARDAMPKGGSLTLETNSVDLDEPHARRLASGPAGRYTVLSVRDTGQGMDEVTLGRIFEPFFTTKPQGQGTGLGLSMVYGIVKQSGGGVRVHSSPGEGTAFEIYLPSVAEEVKPAEETRRPGRAASGWETVLVVEDEAGVRKLICTGLRKAGYTVLEARNGEEALKIAGEREIQLLVTDVVMPGMGGAELTKQMAVARPALKVLLMSGYSESPVARDMGMPFLQKPFTPVSLTAKVREVLDAK